jgi:hypothetical protein
MLCREACRWLSVRHPALLRAAQIAAAPQPAGDDLPEADPKFHEMPFISAPAHLEASEDAQRLHAM